MFRDKDLLTSHERSISHRLAYYLSPQVKPAKHRYVINKEGSLLKDFKRNPYEIDSLIKNARRLRANVKTDSETNNKF
jgi:hypothetical protein